MFPVADGRSASTTERGETELFAYRRGADGDLALALIRDDHATRSFDTLLRCRGGALARQRLQCPHHRNETNPNLAEMLA
jgi:hypothetical protein